MDQNDSTKQISYLVAALKAPRVTDAASRLATQARDANWSIEDCLAAAMEREVSARQAPGFELRIHAAGLPTRKSLEDFDFDVQSSVRGAVAALVSDAYLHMARNIVPLGPTGTGETHLAIGLAIAAVRQGHRILFAPAGEWVTLLSEAHQRGLLGPELARLRHFPLLVVDEVYCLPFEQESANLFLQLVSLRYERASIILTSNLPFSVRGGVLGDQVVAAAMIDRIVDHTDLITLKGPSYRRSGRGVDNLPSVMLTADDNS